MTAEFHRSKAWELQVQGKLDESEKEYTAALELAQHSNQNELEGKIIAGLGYLYQINGEPQKAQQKYKGKK